MEGGLLVRTIHSLSIPAALAAVAILLSAAPNAGLAQTTISSIIATPNPLNVDRASQTQIVVIGTPGQTNLSVRIFRDDQVTVVRSGLMLTETATAGEYNTTWDGRNQSSQLVASGPYKMRVFNLSTTTDIGPYGSINITRMAESIVQSPDPFTPDGASQVTIRVTGEPNATDLEVYFYENGERRFSLIEEPAGSGVYYTTQTLVYNGSTFAYNGDRNLYVRTTDRQKYANISGLLRVRTFSYLTRDKDTYFPTKGDIATLSASGAAGQAPRAIVYFDNERQTGMFYKRRDFGAALWAGAGDHGWIYAAGEYDQNNSWVEGAPLLADGRLGAWRRLNQMPQGRQGAAVVANGGWLYVTGGYYSGVQSTVYRAPIQPDGSLGDWVTDAVALPEAAYYHAAAAANGFLYVAGNWAQGRNVYIAPFNPDGSLGSFQSAGQFLIGRSYFSMIASGGWLYAVGGYGADKSVERAAINPDGTLEPWQAASSLVTGRYGHGLAVLNGHLLAAGGYNGASLGHNGRIETAPIMPDGSLGAWTTVGDMNLKRYEFGTVVSGNRVYFIGGYDPSIGSTRGVEYTEVQSDGSLAANPPLFTDYAVLDLPEDPAGTYTATWGFKDTAGNDTPRGYYSVYLYNRNNGYYYQHSTSFRTDFSVLSVTADPNPFLPEGDNTATITIVSDPGQRAVCYNAASIVGALAEVAPGVYQAHESMVYYGEIREPGTYTIYFVNEEGSYNYDTTGQIQIIHTSGLGVSPSTFAPSEGETATFSLTGETNQDLLVQIQRDGETAAGTGYRRDGITHSAARVDSTLFVSGGTGSSYSETTPETSVIQPDGSLSVWLPRNRTTTSHVYSTMAATSKTLYMIGGYSPNTNVVEYAPIGPDGSLGAWQTTTPLPEWRGIAPGFTWGGYVFLAGGYSYADRSDILRAAIQPDGSLGEWTQAGTLPKGLYGEGLVLAGNRVYVAGGYSWSGGYQTSAYMAELQPDGTFSAWTTLASMNQPRYLFGLAYVQGYLFAIGGEGQSDNYTIERAHVLGDGTLGAWEMLGVRSPSPTRFALVEGGNNRLYMIGGGSSSRAVYYADVDAVGNLSAFQGTPLGELPLVEDPAGTYNAPWNGRDAKGNLVPTGSYSGRLLQARTRVPFHSRSAGVTIKDVISTFEVIPQTFVPTGLNFATLRATGSPGQVGLYANWDRQVNLTETAPGVYEATYNFVRNDGTIQGETNSYFYLYDSNGNYTGLSALFYIRHIRNLQANPYNYYPTAAGDKPATFTLTGEEGLNLTTYVYENNERVTGLLSPRRNISHSTFAHNGRAYVFGGYTPDGRSETGEVFDLKPDGRTSRPRILRPMSVARDNVSVAAYEGWLYAAGGYTDSTYSYGSDIVERAPILPDGRIGPWETQPSLQLSRYAAAMVAHNGWLYILGGYRANSGYLDSIERAPIGGDGALGAWESAGSLPGQRYGLRADVYNGYLYVFGGYWYYYNVNRAPINPDGTIGAWETLSGFNSDKYNFGLARYGSYYYAFGSESGGSRAVEMAEILPDGTLSPWTQTTPLPVEIYNPGAVAGNGWLYAIGGNNSSTGYSRAIRHAPIHPDGTLGDWTGPMLPSGPMTNSAITVQAFGSDSTWRASSDLQPDWTQPNFDDSGWAQSSAPNPGACGATGCYFSGEQIPTQPMWAAEEQTLCYLRKEIVIPAGVSILSAWIQIGADDDFDLYVNGTLAASEANGWGGPTIQTDISLYLHEGVNVIAIMGNDSAGGCRSICAYGEAAYIDYSAPPSTYYWFPWNGLDSDGNLAPQGTYIWYVNNADSGRRYPPTSYTIVGAGVNEVVADPAVLVANGRNVTTFTIHGTPGILGMYLHFYGPQHTDWYNGRFMELFEGEEGIYTAAWNGVARDTSNQRVVFPNGVYSINVYDKNGNFLNDSASFEISGISSITVPPEFTPGGGALMPIQLEGAPGLGPILTIENASTGYFVRELPTVEAAGIYAAEWDGRDAGGNYTGPNPYRVRIFTNTTPRERYSIETTFNVKQAVFGIEVAPNPFTADGSAQATITVLADSGQTGLTAEVTHPGGARRTGIVLSEQGSVGTYIGTWDGRDDSGQFMSDGVAIVEIRSPLGELFPISGSVTLSTITRFVLSPNPFTPRSDPGVTIEVDMLGGLNIEARIGLVATADLSDSFTLGHYTGFWDGKGADGNFARPGLYSVTLRNKDSGLVFSQARALTVNEVDLTPPKATVAWAAPAPPLAPGSRAFTLTANEPLGAAPSFSLTPLGGAPIAASFGAPSNGNRTWPGTLVLPPTVQTGWATFAWSGVDVSGNRGDQFTHGNTVEVDSIGPSATVSVSPSSNSSFGAGLKTVTVWLTEDAPAAPALSFAPPVGSPVAVGLTGGPRSWTGSMNVTAGMGDGQATFAIQATDRAGNVGTVITSGAMWTIDLIPPGAPALLTATSQSAGRIALAWIGATGQPYNYQLWRAPGAGVDPLAAGQRIQPAMFSNSFTDTPPSEGDWSYAVTATDRAGNVGPASNTASANSDATPPGAPTNLAANNAAEQIRLTWDAPAGEIPAFYNVFYRPGADPITSTAGVARIKTGVAALEANVNPQPVGNQQYAVTAVDAAGNESGVSNSALFFWESPLGAPASISILYDPSQGAQISWSSVSTAAGYNVYRDGLKITQAPVAGLAYLDPDAPPAATAVYSVRAVTAGGTPGDARTGTFRPLVVNLPAGSRTIETQLLAKFPIEASNPAPAPANATGVTIDLLDAAGAVAQTHSQPFARAIDPGATETTDAIFGVTAYPARARCTVQLTSGEAGVTLAARRTFDLTLRPAGVRVEVFPEPLIRGVAAQVRLRFTNPGAIPIDLVTAIGTDPSTDIVVDILDSAGTVLASANLYQRSGAGIYATPSWAKAVIEPNGGTFLTTAIAPVVPLDAPATVFLRGRAVRTYYNYGVAGQVEGPGMTSALVSSQPTETDYRGIVQSDAALYGLGTPVQLSGMAISNTTGLPVPNAPLKVGIDVRGFPRFYQVISDNDGNFSFPFQPFTNEFGHYTSWAVHPTVSDRPVQAEWEIGGMRMPSPFSVRMAKNSTLQFDVDVTSLSAIPLTGLAVQWLPDPGAEVLVTTPTLGTTTLAPGAGTKAHIAVFAPIDAPSAAYGRLRITAAEGLAASSQFNYELRPAQPVIRANPNYIQASLGTRGSYAAEISIENIGFDDLRNARMATPSASWIYYTSNSNLGTIPPGGKRVIGVVLQPGGVIPAGLYSEQITLLSDNSSPISYNVFATITSSEKGSLLFHAEDVLSPALEGALVEVEAVLTAQLTYRGNTDASGEWLLENIPAGEYNYRVSAAGRTAKIGRVTVTADDTQFVRAFLVNTFVTVTWEVVPVIIEDRYEITLTTTFETNVPAPVLVADPPSLVHPMTRPGVSNAMFKVTNRGLIAGHDFRITPNTSSPGMRLEVLVDLVDTILAMQTIEVPYRVILDEVAQTGGKRDQAFSGLAPPLPGMPQYSVFGKDLGEVERTTLTDIPIPDFDCGLAGQLLAILNYICRLESISTGVDHSVRPEVAAAAAGIGGALDPASYVCLSTGCDDCCVALASCAIPAPGSLGTPSCYWNIA